VGVVRGVVLEICPRADRRPHPRIAPGLIESAPFVIEAA
jgi:hypothetical protein